MSGAQRSVFGACGTDLKLSTRKDTSHSAMPRAMKIASPVQKFIQVVLPRRNAASVRLEILHVHLMSMMARMSDLCSTHLLSPTPDLLSNRPKRISCIAPIETSTYV